MSRQPWASRTCLAVIVFGVVAPAGALSVAASSRAAMPPGVARGVRPAALAASSSRCWSPREAERGFQRQINESRGQGGRGRLRLDPELSKAARVHTREMVDRTLLHHTATTTLGRRVTRWNLLGENVGVGNTVDTLHTAFMNSPAHRANIMLSSFRFVGVGAVEAKDRLWVTVIFENRTDPGTRLRMPRC